MYSLIRPTITALLLACGSALHAEITTLAELEAAFPAAQCTNHNADLQRIAESIKDDAMLCTVSSVEGLEFKNCLTIDVRQPSDTPYYPSVTFTQDFEWKKGDVGMVAFYARSVSSESAIGANGMLMQFKPESDHWAAYYLKDMCLDTDWQLVMAPFEVGFDGVNTSLNLFFGSIEPQVLELAAVTVYKYNDEVSLAELPRSKIIYPGQDADAAWRAAAAERIEQHRKAQLSLKLVDAHGKPVKNAQVRVEMTRHAFGFGAAISTERLASPKVPADQRASYAEILKRTCNRITPENAMKWRLHEHMKYNVPAMLDWAKANNIEVRGHLFVWPGFERLPDGYNLYKEDPEAFRQDIIDHIYEFANLFPDSFTEWDVMNEPYTEHDFMDLLGKDVVLDWFKAARDANPNYTNYINDYGILSDRDQKHQDVYFDWIQYLVDNDAEIDGIGFQGHYKSPTPPQLIWERLERFAALGLPMQITEYDFDHPDEDLQAQFTEDFMTIVFSHPQMTSLVTWTFLENTFRPDGAFYNKDFTPRKVGLVWERLINETWKTDERHASDKNGELSLSAFKGDYRITIEHDGKTSEHTVELDQETELELLIP
ncbi:MULTISPECIES: endo-1,4-beta-xylanase [unclassified Lentimonas]|uniref:endo-1,4-beta-xylanase n=1 Tax=unclassified Lentimonas TaxID=2630993 RepID=UPI00132404F6|nr:MULTISPECIES: endo-1,4-beta-xylanase [unclassified Lentimonas]CAA6677904.1 Endo-1,4-beta-xylanase A precursor (EC [Lentimonas sp. CC4]CAA6684008.1 Endo-1,4-beta-xylanase A precursor (EC [Lentimonas sp. CC6]CAA7076616.1 Endo-1,4-beta-xylanase A precursor (EC [Lentimonas sp. CC4]CAA7170055.1 Endo-1,4-beta-xylanase A precursor (EC [Lentimonas sp. CC21]CAA7181340.1 Endo-1,4-beta-xylanase A precursor (EC [Lentimonas sp. CC8]